MGRAKMNYENLLIGLSEKEFREWVDRFGGERIELNAPNVEKIFRECWQLWDTYNSEDVLSVLFSRTDGLENVLTEDINIDGLIADITENDITYTLHQYADYTTIFFDLRKSGIRIRCMNTNENAYANIEKDIAGGLLVHC